MPIEVKNFPGENHFEARTKLVSAPHLLGGGIGIGALLPPPPPNPVDESDADDEDPIPYSSKVGDSGVVRMGDGMLNQASIDGEKYA